MKHIHYISIILLLIVVILLQRSCSKPLTVANTVYKTDTLIAYTQRTDTVEGSPRLVSELRVDSFIVYEPVDRLGCNDYNVVREYTDTARFKEGSVVVNNSVHQNQIKNQRIIINLDSIPATIITNTITNTVEAKKRNSIWFGANGGWRSDTTLQVGASLMFQNKKKLGLEIGAKIDNRGLVTYEAGIKVKL